MPEIRSICGCEAAPIYTGHVLVQRFSDVTIVHGLAVESDGGATFFAPAPFPIFKEALAHAEAWASKKGLSVVYVRGVQAA